MEEAAARNQAMLGEIRVAAEGPELTGVSPGIEKEPGIEKKATGHPGNVEAGGMKTGPGVAGSTEVHPETKEALA